MVLAVDCTKCGNEVIFNFAGEKKYPTEVCECGAVYKMKVTRID